MKSVISEWVHAFYASLYELSTWCILPPTACHWHFPPFALSKFARRGRELHTPATLQPTRNFTHERVAEHIFILRDNWHGNITNLWPRRIYIV